MKAITPFLNGGIRHLLLFISLGFFLLIVRPSISCAQEARVYETEQPGKVKSLAPVKVDGKTLFFVTGVSSYPAEQRAAAISERIEAAAANPSISADSVKIIASPDYLGIYAGNSFILNVYDSDIKAEGIQASVLAVLLKSRVKSSIILYRSERSRPVLIKKTMYAIGAAALLFIILTVFLWAVKRINRILEARIREKLDIVDHKSFNLIRSAQLWKAFHMIFHGLRLLIIIITLVIFAQYILGLFPWTNSIAVYILNLFMTPVLAAGKGILNFLPSLAFLIVIFLVTRYLLKLVKLLFNGIGQGAIVLQNFKPEWAIPTYRIIRLFVIVFASIIAYPYIPGSETSAFKGVSVFLGVLFSLGSSSFLGNVIAGYSMTYRSAFKKGDRIQVEDHIGFVEDQKLLITRLRTIKNEEIIIPNSILLNSHIMNYSSMASDKGLIIHTTVGIGYETPWRLVDAMLLLAADRTEGLLKEPPPYVLKKELGDFCVTYEINAYCNDAARLNQLYSVLHQNILDIFNENDVQIMTPAYEGDPEIPKVVPREQWDLPLKRDG